jgi:hypothetical protein
MELHPVRSRLNEILKVRHAFAHGFAIPPYAWTQARAGGRVRLTTTAVIETERFLQRLVRVTDNGMKGYLAVGYGAATSW